MKTMHLNLFIYGCGHHRAAWRHADSSVHRLGELGYYQELAQIAERGKFDAVFFADGQSAENASDGPRWFLEPLTLLAGLADATERIGLISTVSSTFYTPFHAARMLASLDHISRGRIGWNVVTSMFDAEARNHGYESMPDHAWRYQRAEEFIDVAKRLWDSWADDAVLLN
ncbi:MAG TPA: LLM class flavin-dependent oxidoreductase, partial [Paenalcaligenes sp.]|nr:LLM class flavin-dependent oxidoreductase [Paenalcaligenes sp.]